MTALFHRTNTPRAKIGAEDETPAPAGPRSAGDVLRQQRAALGLDLGEVAKELRIKPVYLAALEEGRPDRLPGPAYAIGFLRVYGDHLGLDSGEILRRFRLEAVGLDAKPDLSFPMPLGERSLPGRTALLVAVVLTICGYASWYCLATGEHSRPERVTEVPANLLSSNSALPSNWAKPATAPITGPAAPAAPTLSATPSTSPAPGPVSAIVNAPPPAPASSQDAAAGGPPEWQSAAPSAYGTVGVPPRIVLRATADSWIQVRDADHRVLFSGVLKAGQSYPVPDQPGLSMRAGNAGGLDVTVDGKPAAPLGPIGTVRNIALDPQSLAATITGQN
ncbi:MAG: helix-turn-helix domain-containing protein [Stellaceae bacterium]